MKKILLLIILFISFIPSISSAQFTCLRLNNELTLGDIDGKTSGEVSQYQQFLKETGYYKGEITGEFDRKTNFATFQFQKINDIADSDIQLGPATVGPKTQLKIKLLSCPTSIDKSIIVATTTLNPQPVSRMTFKDNVALLWEAFKSLFVY